MSSPTFSGCSTRSSCVSSASPDLFDELLSQMKECHTNVIESLQAKVAKLKQDRCLDAKRLEEFYHKNQLLREQQKSLQDNVKVLEERLRVGPCDRCTVAEKQTRKKQEEFDGILRQKQFLISELEAERDVLQEQNNGLKSRLEQLQKSNSPLKVSSETEDGVIPDSPLQAVSLGAAGTFSKMRRRKEQGHARYSERPLSQSTKGVSFPLASVQSYGKGVLVPETCEMDVNPVLKGSSLANENTVVETCQMNHSEDDSQSVLHPFFESSSTRNTSVSDPENPSHPINADSSRHNLLQRISPHQQLHPTATPKPCIAPLQATHQSPHEPVKRKGACNPSTGKENKEDGNVPSVDLSSDGRSEKRRCMAPWPPDFNSNTGQPSEEKSQASDAFFKQPRTRGIKTKSIHEAQTDGAPQVQISQFNASEKNRSCLQEAKEDSWSLDPAAVLSQYETASPHHPESETEGETVDMDATYLSHSVLIRAKKGFRTSDPKANGSLSEIFDKTSYGEYESCPQEEEEVVEEGQTTEENDEEPEITMDEIDKMSRQEHLQDLEKGHTSVTSVSPRNTEGPGYAYVDVVRNRNDRRKLQGHVCKECELYYADLPEEERAKKLASCSRHRYRFLPPATPEHFWEVGFPSTQTCQERGYIKEEKEPDLRRRRRRPYVATFTPKSKD